MVMASLLANKVSTHVVGAKTNMYSDIHCFHWTAKEVFADEIFPRGCNFLFFSILEVHISIYSWDLVLPRKSVVSAPCTVQYLFLYAQLTTFSLLACLQLQKAIAHLPILTTGYQVGAIIYDGKMLVMLVYGKYQWQVYQVYNKMCQNISIPGSWSHTSLFV